MRNVIALCVGLALAWGLWSTGVAVGGGSEGPPSAGAAPIHQAPTYGHPAPNHRPRVVGGSRPSPAPDIPVPTHSQDTLDRALLSGVWRLPACRSAQDVFCTGSDSRGLWWRDAAFRVVHQADGANRIEEDEPGWDCATMGNEDCG